MLEGQRHFDLLLLFFAWSSRLVAVRPQDSAFISWVVLQQHTFLRREARSLLFGTKVALSRLVRCFYSKLKTTDDIRNNVAFFVTFRSVTNEESQFRWRQFKMSNFHRLHLIFFWCVQRDLAHLFLCCRGCVFFTLSGVVKLKISSALAKILMTAWGHFHPYLWLRSGVACWDIQKLSSCSLHLALCHCSDHILGDSWLSEALSL